MRGIYCQRSEHREDLTVEERLSGIALGFSELGPTQQLDAVVAKRGHHLFMEDVGVLALKCMGSHPDVLENFARRQAAGRAHGDAGGNSTLEAGHANHEELVEVAGEDGEELGPLERGQGVVLGELEHALIEIEPGELAVQETVGREVAALHWKRGRLSLSGGSLL